MPSIQFKPGLLIPLGAFGQMQREGLRGFFFLNLSSSTLTFYWEDLVEFLFIFPSNYHKTLLTLEERKTVILMNKLENVWTLKNNHCNSEMLKIQFLYAQNDCCSQFYMMSRRLSLVRYLIPKYVYWLWWSGGIHPVHFSFSNIVSLKVHFQCSFFSLVLNIACPE